jgi:PhzF family phenazine biosynthesis protein
VLPAANATAHVRIFTPTFEMPFAGHPTLGTAHVVRDLISAGDALTLQMKAGVIPVTAQGDVWTLQANAPVPAVFWSRSCRSIPTTTTPSARWAGCIGSPSAGCPSSRR